MRVLLSLAVPPLPLEPTGRSERPARMAKHQRRPEWRQGRPAGRPEGTRGAEQSEHRSALDANGGRSYLGAPENGLEARAVSLPQVKRLVDVEQIKNGGQGETA